VTPSEFREDLDIHKTRMKGLSCGEEIMTLRSAVLIQCQRVTDGRTDRRTSSLYLLRASAWLTHVKTNKKDGYRQQNVRQRQKLISIIDYDVCILEYLQPFWRFSTLKNGLTLKSGYGVLQGH